ncbi:MAG: riboflavin synthase [Alphaproteobacteria bacterium]
MFTGIVTDIGEISEISLGNGAKLTLIVPFPTDGVAIGASVACSGICLTVTGKGENTLSFEASEETLGKTTLGSWLMGGKVNLERSLKAGDELGGHFVMGHVDATAEVLEVTKLEGAKNLTLSLPKAMLSLVAKKGSVAIDGVSLTVNEIGKSSFEVAIIPHTEKVTTLGALKAGDKVNLEADVFARYSARLIETGK